MLGIDDFWILVAYILCLVSVSGCIAYGILKWNVEAEEEAQQ